MLENKKAIIFDLDGTLIDSVGVWNKVDEKLIKEIKTIEFDNVNISKQRDEKLKEYSNCKDAYLEYCGFLKEKYKSKISKEDIKKRRYEIADKYLKEEIDYKPNAENVLKYLKEKGFILVIASTTNDHAIENYKKYNKNIINKANFEDIFSLIYSKESVEKLKPNPEIHYKILENLKLKPEECLIVEDSLIGVEAANNANIDVAVIYDKYSDNDRASINKLSKYQFKNFYEMLDYLKKELGN